jgi:outer membrane cobalamin receptor
MLTDGKTAQGDDESEDLLTTAQVRKSCDRQEGECTVNATRMRHLMRIVLLIFLGSVGQWITAIAQDSVRVIDNVTVRSKIRYHETITPQTLKGEDLEKVNAHTVADALRFMSGVQLKDYGGIGGLKTVNLRSLGSQHVGIYYDGIELGNAQNGAIDLGQFSLDNIEEVSVYQGQRSAIMQTASDFANAGSVYIKTMSHLGKRSIRERGNEATKSQYLKTRIQSGSSNLLRLSALFESNLTQNLLLSANAECLSTNGKYDFRYRRRNHDGSIAYDTTATRQNGDVQALRVEVNLYGNIVNGHWQAKAYTYHSSRGIPGAIVNNVWRRGERQSDDNTFVQGTWQKDVNPIYTLRAMAKYANYRTHYLNKDTTQMMVDNTYRQQEAYLSLVNVFEIAPWWSVSLSDDMRWNYLDADMSLFVHPTRWSILSSLATAMDLNKVQLQGSIVFSQYWDKTQSGSQKQSINSWTPALFASYRPFDILQLSGFIKKSYRMPTFNDLYYTNIGNAFLRPESAIQYDLGVRVFGKAKLGFSDNAALTGSLEAHIYHNSVHDKIVAYPKGQQFRWTMLNLGRVHIDGIDVQAQGSWMALKNLRLSSRLQYTYQRARDVTDKATSYYGDQIPYTPWHSGSATLMADYKAWDLAYNFVYTGERYCQQENILYNHVEPWYTSDVHLSWRHTFDRTLCKATLEVNNLFDQQYDVIINYPMPGRNFNVTIQCEF